MIKVGITGGIGSGKSIICEIFKQLKVPVYNADSEAKNLINTDKEVQKRIIEEFGTSVFPGNELNRNKLAEIVFNDPSALTKLNNIVHPAVHLHFQKWLMQQTHPYILKEAAILFESGTYKNMDYIVTVYAPEKLRIERVMKRDSVAAKEVEKRMKHQISEEEKIKRSDFVIYNDDRQLVLPQVLDLHKKLLETGSK